MSEHSALQFMCYGCGGGPFPVENAYKIGSHPAHGELFTYNFYCEACARKRLTEPSEEMLYEQTQAATNQYNPLADQLGGTHYKDMKIQVVEFCQTNGFPYCESQAIKYIARHRKKNGAEDIRKAIHLLQILLKLEYPNAT